MRLTKCRDREKFPERVASHNPAHIDVKKRILTLPAGKRTRRNGVREPHSYIRNARWTALMHQSISGPGKIPSNSTRTPLMPSTTAMSFGT